MFDPRGCAQSVRKIAPNGCAQCAQRTPRSRFYLPSHHHPVINDMYNETNQVIIDNMAPVTVDHYDENYQYIGTW